MLLTFENGNGDSFTITGNYILSKNWGGFSDVPTEIKSTKAPYQNGRTYVDTIIDARNIFIEFLIKGNERQDIFDRRLTVANRFNPKLGLGTLKWEQEDGTTYYLDCIPFAPIFPGGKAQSKWYQQVIIRLFAPNPFWYNDAQQQEILVGFSGGWSYDWSYPKTYGQIGTQITVTNNGGVETPVEIYFYGQIEDPVITNETTEESITIEHTIPDGDVLIINTAFGEKSAQILSGGVYTNAFQYVDPDSDFFNLKPGDNVISYSSTTEGENAECRLLYYERWGGV